MLVGVRHLSNQVEHSILLRALVQRINHEVRLSKGLQQREKDANKVRQRRSLLLRPVYIVQAPNLFGQRWPLTGKLDDNGTQKAFRGFFQFVSKSEIEVCMSHIRHTAAKLLDVLHDGAEEY